MRENSGFIIACGLLWATVLVAVCIEESDTGSLLVLFLVPVVLLGFVLLFVIAVVRLFMHRQLPLSKRAVALWFATVPVLTYVIIGTILTEIKKENTWLTIKRYDFQGSTNFTFLRNGEYNSWRDSPLGMSAEESGRYERQDSILILHPESKDGKTQTFKLIIHPYSEFKKPHANSAITLTSLDTTVKGY